MKKIKYFQLNIVTLLTLSMSLSYTTIVAESTMPPVTFIEQGQKWTVDSRKDFYDRDQGSRIMPYNWIKALKQPNGEPFMQNSLDRYGYLPNKYSDTVNLPIGFNIAKKDGQEYIGMTCSACHTRQIKVENKRYRIDGGPAIVDFQSFLSDLDTSVDTILKDDESFNKFAEKVLNSDNSSINQKRLKMEIRKWYLPYNILIEKSLPTPAWGPSRLDAVSMIFNRLTGLDIGNPPDYIIEENIKLADAPVRYPFLWNASIQDKTQWPGFADNGSPILGLSRNLGEVYGVFGEFHFDDDSYIKQNTANFKGLKKLEKLVKKIGTPKWPWKLDIPLVEKGKKIYNQKIDGHSCIECHGITKGETRFPKHRTWKTPIVDVETDTRAYSLLSRKALSGALEGQRNLPWPLGDKLKHMDLAINILGTVVTRSIIEDYTTFDYFRDTSPDTFSPSESKHLKGASVLPPELKQLEGAFVLPPELKQLEGAFVLPEEKSKKIIDTMKYYEEYKRNKITSGKYAARVLEGIWAAAPYLHNGSVPTLKELLKPAKDRVSQFKIGSNYDIENVGLAIKQDSFDYTFNTTGCSQLNSGYSNCGHEYGTTLPEEDKTALIEYLKSL